MENLLDMYRCTPRQIAKFMVRCLAAGVVCNIVGSPGIGKSSIGHQVAKRWNLFLIDHRLSTSAPEDLSGLPRFNEKGEAVFAPFAELFPLEDTPIPNGYDGWLLFLDELTSAKEEVQAAAYKLILDHMTGQRRLHPRCLIVCAGNLLTDRAIVNPLSTAMQSRMCNLEMMINFDEWLLDVALPQKWDERIIGFLNEDNGRLMDFDPQKATEEKNFNCPRTWEFMNRFMTNPDGTPVKYELTMDRGREIYTMEDETPMFAGTITSGSAVEFVQFTKVYHNMPLIKDILRNPLGTPVPLDQTTRWAITSRMVANMSEENFPKLAKYADRMDLGFRALFYRGVLANDAGFRHHPDFAQAATELYKYLFI